MIKKAFLLNDDNKANNDKEANICFNRLDKIKNENNEKSIINISKNISKIKVHLILIICYNYIIIIINMKINITNKKT